MTARSSPSQQQQQQQQPWSTHHSLRDPLHYPHPTLSRASGLEHSSSGGSRDWSVAGPLASPMADAGNRDHEVAISRSPAPAANGYESRGLKGAASTISQASYSNGAIAPQINGKSAASTSQRDAPDAMRPSAVAQIVKVPGQHLSSRPIEVPAPPPSLKAQGKARATEAQRDEVVSSRASLPGGSAFVSHSRLFRSPSPPQTGQEEGQQSLDALKAELNNEADGLIPLAAVVERVASESYDTLLNLGETMTSLSSSSRRAKIYSAALDLRRQMIKLLVLTKWSKGGNHLQHLKNVIGLIHEQSYQTVDAREHLAESKGILPNARERNHDVVTAIDVLSAGEPQRLLTKIEGDSIPSRPMSDLDARSTVHELDEAIRTRLICEEAVPFVMQRRTYNVSDGRAHLSADNLFQADLTLSGSKSTDRWYLLKIVFDYAITGSGKDRFPTDLWEHQREGFIATANEILAPVEEVSDSSPLSQEQSDRLVSAKDAAAGNDVANGNTEPPLVQSTTSTPLVRLFDFLQSQALEYQLDILAYQIADLARLRWRGDLTFSWQNRTLLVDYWASRPDASGQGDGPSSSDKRPFEPLKGGRIEFSIVDEGHASSKQGLLASLGRHKSQQTVSGEGELQPLSGQGKSLHLQMRWDADPRLQASADYDASDTTLYVDAHDLDAEKLIRALTLRHATVALLAIRRTLQRDSFGRTFLSDRSVESSTADGDDSAVLLISLHEAVTLCLRVESKSGKLSLSSEAMQSSPFQEKTAPALSNSWLSSQLREAGLALNESSTSIIDVLRRLRASAIIVSIEQRAAYHGLSTVRRMPLNQEEYAKLGVQPSCLLFMPLQQCRDYYCLFKVGDHEVSVGVACLEPFIYASNDTPNASGTLIIQSLQWLDVDRITQVSGERRPTQRALGCSGARTDRSRRSSLSGMDIARLHSFTVAMTLSSQLQAQLRMRGVTFSFLPPRSAPCSSKRRKILSGIAADDGDPVGHAKDVVPTISARTLDLFGPSAACLLHSNVHIELKQYWSRTLCHVELKAKIKFRLPPTEGRPESSSMVGMSGGLLGSEAVQCDAADGTLLFKAHNLEQALDIFTYEWQPIARIASLASLLSRPMTSSPAGPVQTLEPATRHHLSHFDLQSVRFRYGQDTQFEVTVRWDPGALLDPTFADLSVEPGYRLSFGVCDGLEADRTQQVDLRNPHHHIESALQALLNKESDVSFPGNAGMPWPKWTAFLRLLEDTLPLLSVLGPLTERSLEDALVPDIEYISATWYRIVFLERYRLDVRIVKGRTFLLQDAARCNFVDDSSNRQLGLHSSLSSQDEIPELATFLARSVRDARGQEEGNGGEATPSALVLGNSLLCDLGAGSSASRQLASRILGDLISALSQSLAEREGLQV
ncbi:unnamed protein product [Parajaminaea phylloscopi]